jgi:hypothetical protein
MNTHSEKCAGESEGGVRQRPNVVTTDPVRTDVPVGEDIARGADFPDTERLRSASHIDDSMVRLAWCSISCACIDITEEKEEGEWGLLDVETKCRTILFIRLWQQG